MNNREIARLLEKLADILQLKDESTFRIKTYRKAALSISRLDEDLQRLYEQNKLDQIPGVKALTLRRKMYAGRITRI